MKKIINKLNKKKILITGGTGSFGSTFAKFLLKNSSCKIVIFSRDEKKQFDLSQELKNNRVKYFIGDVRDYKSVNSALSQRVDYVFHAAALKQVPSCEYFPLEAIKTNILGAENVMDAATSNNVKKVVLLSTDKSVYPINSMGLTKSLMEKIMISKSKNSSKTSFVATRYGNVMGTRGSVIPLFIDQIRKGKNLTVTNSNMTRFLMSIEESVYLVLHALVNVENGHIVVQKSPAASVHTLTKSLIKIFNSKSKIKIIGTRGGEKHHEVLVSKEEMSRAKSFKKFYDIPPETNEIENDKYFFKGKSDKLKKDEYSSSNTFQLNVDKTILKLKESLLVKNLLKL
ncbi:SDR family NAD(P)-dependent oxidoreductase [Candidatus Pelagibacter sp. HIMB1715]|uniref:SDR family NAD(P)-dependent oxidoreductase n=1 Tax=Candidatus Pelagibacter sp. HIMB1715 TaxID=3413369 RepID=UPI003F873161